MTDFSPSNNTIDNKLLDTIEDILFNNNIELELGQLYIVINHMLKYSNFVIKYKNKVRNIKTYIHKTYGSLSKFIVKNTKYKIEEINGLSYIMT